MPDIAIKDMSATQKKEEIGTLLRKLQRESDDTSKRKIRQRLRNLGHTGGLGLAPGRPKGKKEAAGKKKGKRAKKVETEPVVASA